MYFEFAPGMVMFKYRQISDMEESLKYMRLYSNFAKLNSGLNAFVGVGKTDFSKLRSEIDKINSEFEDMDKEATAYKTLKNLGYKIFDNWNIQNDPEANIAYQKYLIKENPNDPNPYNSLAWEQAKSNTNLDEGIQLAQKSVSLGKSAANLDTLAELYFLKGENENAVKTSEEALKLAEEYKVNNINYYIKQLEKIKLNDLELAKATTMTKEEMLTFALYRMLGLGSGIINSKYYEEYLDLKHPGWKNSFDPEFSSKSHLNDIKKHYIEEVKNVLKNIPVNKVYKLLIRVKDYSVSLREYDQDKNGFYTFDASNHIYNSAFLDDQYKYFTEYTHSFHAITFPYFEANLFIPMDIGEAKSFINRIKNRRLYPMYYFKMNLRPVKSDGDYHGTAKIYAIELYADEDLTQLVAKYKDIDKVENGRRIYPK